MVCARGHVGSGAGERPLSRVGVRDRRDAALLRRGQVDRARAAAATYRWRPGGSASIRGGRAPRSSTGTSATGASCCTRRDSTRQSRSNRRSQTECARRPGCAPTACRGLRSPTCWASLATPRASGWRREHAAPRPQQCGSRRRCSPAAARIPRHCGSCGSRARARREPRTGRMRRAWPGGTQVGHQRAVSRADARREWSRRQLGPVQERRRPADRSAFKAKPVTERFAHRGAARDQRR